MSLDEKALQGLLDDSQDIQSDAMKASREPLAEMVELGHERRARGVDADEVSAFSAERRRLITRSMVGVGAFAGFGGALLSLFDSPAYADMGEDIQILQTAASIENLAVATYTTALTLDFIGGGSANAVVKAFVTKTKEQHAEHGKAFNAAITNLGGKTQDQPDPVLLGVVNEAKPKLTSAAAVVDLALQLEDGATQTYVANTAALTDVNARKVTASIMGVEAQHTAILRAVKALLAANAPQLIALPPDAAALPPAAGGVGFPDGFYKTDQARPSSEGAVK